MVKVNNLDPQLIGQMLLKRGFRDYFLYMFKVIEERPFIVEELHSILFEAFQAIWDLIITRANINIPPRAGKTTLAIYFLTFALAHNKKCNFIYTSYSQDLLTTISSKVASILQHPIYRAMFPHSIAIEEFEVNPVNEFWKQYLKEEGRKEKYLSRLIQTNEGGQLLFSAMGGQVTGYGASIRNSKGFTGALLIDDPSKPSDMNYPNARKKTLEYFQETLLSRLNTSTTPIVNIMQRLHVEDLSAYLESIYNFETIKAPLVLENGTCQLPSQYNEARLKELQLNQYVWQAQYQQEPIIKGGQVIKRDWWQYYPVDKNFKYKRLLIASDTAMKIKTHNDYSVFMVGAVTTDNKLHILDIIRGKWEAPELEKMALQIWEKYKYDRQNYISCSGLYVEDKASGTGLLQGLQRKGIPIKGVKAEADKYSRISSLLNYIATGVILLPVSPSYAFNPDFLNECEAFTKDDTHPHDDQLDALYYLVTEALAKHNVSILDYYLNEK